MLRQIRFLYDAEVKRLNPRSVQKAIKQMQNQQSAFSSKITVRPHPHPVTPDNDVIDTHRCNFQVGEEEMIEGGADSLL